MANSRNDRRNRKVVTKVERVEDAPKERNDILDIMAERDALAESLNSDNFVGGGGEKFERQEV